MAWNCPKCGTKVSSIYVECSKCGANKNSKAWLRPKVEKKTGTDNLQNQTSRRTMSLPILISIGIVFVIFILIAIIAVHKDSETTIVSKNVAKEEMDSKKSTCQIGDQYKSWDIILTTEELNASIDKKQSNDTEPTSNVIILKHGVNSISNHTFNYRDSDDYYQIRINIIIFKEIKDANLDMEQERLKLFTPTVKENKSTKLERYDNENNTQIKDNPFYSKSVNVGIIGDESFGSQWESFAPEVHFRIGNVNVRISVNITDSNGSYYHNEGSFAKMMQVAHMQEEKIRNIINKECH
ncbi:MAG: zinc ribbon domain-containing protein [Nitrospirae bacterium]|nr:zinc ribbon domain-containing protein [Nitrospirota bacterium]